MIAIVVLSVALSLFIGILFLCTRSIGRIHHDLDEFMSRARKAETIDELENVDVALRLYASKECWHRRLGDRVREIRAYIQGRIK